MIARGRTGPGVAGWGDETADHADLIAALIIRPSSHAWHSVRAAWLFQTADALADAGYPADAEATRDRAMRLVRDAIAAVAGEDEEASK